MLFDDLKERKGKKEKRIVASTRSPYIGTRVKTPVKNTPSVDACISIDNANAQFE